MLRQVEKVALPLSYPQPAGEFYGYDQQQLPPGNAKQHNIKKLVTSVCWMATVLIAWHAGKTVTGKRESVQLYRTHVHDEWAPFVEEVYERGHDQWHYLVPQEPAERQQLRDLCARTLAFENYYLHQYKQYLLEEAEKDGEGKRIAIQQLSKFLTSIEN